ncbi:MAG: PAS domain S-box protein, partial [Bacteroidota bacterium]
MNAEEFYEHLLTHSFDAVAVLNKNGFMKYMSPSVERFLGYCVEELVGKNLYDFVYPEDINLLQQLFYQLNIQDKHYAEVALHVLHKEGGRKFVLIKAKNQLQHPVLSGLVCNLADITPEAHSHVAVKQYNLFKSFFDSGKDAMVVLDKHFRVMSYNGPAKTLAWEVIQQELQQGKEILAYIPPLLREDFTNKLENCLKGKKTQLEVPFPLPDEKSLWVECHIAPIYDGHGDILAIGLRGIMIQQKKMTAKQLLDIQKNLKALFDSSKEVIFIVDANLKIVWLNQAAIRLTLAFFEKPAQIGDDILTYSQLPEEKQASLVEHIHQCFQGAPLHIDRRFEKRNGEPIWYQINYTPLYEENNEIFAVCIGAIDITDRKMAEERLRSLNSQLIAQNKELARQESQLKEVNRKLLEKQQQLQLAFQELSDRNFELDQLMYKTSHDIRSPLTSILGLVNLMKIEGVPARIEEYVHRIETSITRLDQFVGSMLSHAKISRQEITTEKIDFEEIIGQAFDSFRYLETFDRVQKTIQVNT